MPLYPGRVALRDDLERIGGVVAAFAEADEELSGILAAEPGEGRRVYVCAYEGTRGRTWLVVDADARPLTSRAAVREAVSIAALCEVAAETAGGGDVAELRAQLLALRVREDPPGIDEAETAALELERAIGEPPRLASAAYLDAVGAATRKLERALGDVAQSPFTEAMRAASGAVDELRSEVERAYKRELS